MLERLQTLRESYGGAAAAEKLRLLRALAHARLPRARAVLRLHEALCFLRAYPDDPPLLEQVERMLAGFAGRADLRRNARALANSGIAGTPIDFRFFWHTAAWLARRWPGRLTIDWRALESGPVLDRRLAVLMPYAENLALDEAALELREWIERLKGPGESDAAFLIRRFEALGVDSFLRESYFEELDVPFRLNPGPETPSRTRARYAPSPVVFLKQAPSRTRHAFAPASRRPLRSVRALPERDARSLIDLARESMIARERDLDVFIHADVRDVRIADCGGGLEFACYGAVPERRQMLDAVYGFLMLKNGVPTGYVLSASLFGSTEIAFNVFETYRGTEAALLFGRSIALVRRLFGSDTFVLDPYQLGHENREGLASGAWWFYYKLGFRPKDPGVRRLARAERLRIRKNPRHRSSIATLEELSAAEMFLHLGRPRRDVIGLLPRENVGLHVVRHLALGFGADRERGLKVCAKEAAGRLGLGSLAGFSPNERLWWERWGPLVCVLPGVERWPNAAKAALVRVVRAKGGRRESDFVRLFDRHRLLRRAVAELAR